MQSQASTLARRRHDAASPSYRVLGPVCYNIAAFVPYYIYLNANDANRCSGDQKNSLLDQKTTGYGKLSLKRPGGLPIA